MNTLELFVNTKRLSLVPISRDFCEVIFHEFTKEITKFMFPQWTGNISDTEIFIDGVLPKMQAGSAVQQVIINKETGEFLGCAGLGEINTNTPELGIWIKKSAHGNKYGREAMQGLKDWADQNLDYEYIKYPVAIENISSRKIAESLGGLVDHEFVGTRQDGVKMNEVEYRIYKN